MCVDGSNNFIEEVAFPLIPSNNTSVIEPETYTIVSSSSPYTCKGMLWVSSPEALPNITILSTINSPPDVKEPPTVKLFVIEVNKGVLVFDSPKNKIESKRSAKS